MSEPLRMHVTSGTKFITKSQGVHTAFVDGVELLKSGPDVKPKKFLRLSWGNLKKPKSATNWWLCIRRWWDRLHAVEAGASPVFHWDWVRSNWSWVTAHRR